MKRFYTLAQVALSCLAPLVSQSVYCKHPMYRLTRLSGAFVRHRISLRSAEFSIAIVIQTECSSGAKRNPLEVSAVPADGTLLDKYIRLGFDTFCTVICCMFLGIHVLDYTVFLSVLAVGLMT